MPSWVVYSRPGCSLCEDLCAELAEWLGPRAAAVQIVDVTGDADLERRYGARLPVLTIDGEFVCAYRLDRARLRPYLGEGWGSPGSPESQGS